RTELTWDRGLLRRVTDPTGVTVEFGYDDHGDLISVTDADGEVARLERDAAGRGTAAITPSGARTEYRYDEGGQLVSRRGPNGARSEEHTSELQSRENLVCRLLLE